MSSAEIQLAAPTKLKNNSNLKQSQQSSTNNNDKLKKRLKHERNGRRRSKSFSGCSIQKLLNPKPVLPSKFLLGGNINDPLNLNSLQDEEINRAMNAVTPKSSPIPTPPRRKGQIEVIIPPNIKDPLNLIDCADDAEYELQLCSPVKKGRKKRLKKRRTTSTTANETNSDVECSASAYAKTPEQSDCAKIPDETNSSNNSATTVEVVPTSLNLNLCPSSPKKEADTQPLSIGTVNNSNSSCATSGTKQKRKSEEHKPQDSSVKKARHNLLDKIVSPVVPQPGAWLKRTNSVVQPNRPHKNEQNNVKIMPSFKEKDKRFQYGNYNRYYGYRNLNNEVDHRLKVFAHHPYLFEGKDILDIGCNIGHVTLSVARDFGARSVTGLDIDDKLISIARKNIKHYVVKRETTSPKDVINQISENDAACSEFFPISMPILYGPIDVPGYERMPKNCAFPNNVTFKRCNYVLDDDSLLAMEQPQFDTILCLSVTKWFHLNWGDNGLKQAFRRMYAQLKPGGKLILEPQNWASYKSKKKLTETIFKNYNSIEFFPEKFTEYLLSPVVGFAKSEILGYPQCHSKGFRRPIQLFTKSSMFLSERVEGTTPNTNPLYNDIYLNPVRSNEKYECSQNSNSMDKEYVYSGILDRYCCCSEDNIKANEEIEESLRKAEEANSKETDEKCCGKCGGEAKSSSRVVDKGEKS